MDQMELANDLISTITSNYSKTWDNLVNYLRIIEEENSIELIDIETENYYTTVPFDMLYGVIKSFFRDNYRIGFWSYLNKNLSWSYSATNYQGIFKGRCFATESEAQYQAIINACEILEEKLTNDRG